MTTLSERTMFTPSPTSRGGRRFPWPIPNGWFAVAESLELRPGQVRSVSYFNRDLVVFRTRSGEVRVLDAYCPHLGAHLGAGGSVIGESLRCPFHAWRFDGASGRCVEVPYQTSGEIPAKAAVFAYPVVERAGLIFAWHHLENLPPWYEVPPMPQYEDPDWTAAEVHEMFVASACQEMAENSADYAHFKYVHGADAIPEDELVIDGHYRRTEGAMLREGGVAGSPMFVRESYGLGLGVLHVGDFFTFVSSTTPIDEEHLHVRWVFSGKKELGDMKDALVSQFLNGVKDDLPIWNAKIYRDPPLLVHGDGPIGRFRKWAEQFYSYPEPAQ